LLTPTSLLAEEAAAAAKSLEPLQILEDCLQAVQSRDFARYVDHLSYEEQRLQAGYALTLAGFMSQSVDSWPVPADPETVLLARALKDLVREHSLSEVSDMESYRHATQARDEMLGQLHAAAWSGLSGAPSTYGSAVIFSPADLRGKCRTSAGLLKDYRQFIIDVLTEAARPTIVSGVQPSESKPTFDFDEYAKSLRGVKWTIYTRGDYAIALAADPGTESQPTTADPAEPKPGAVPGVPATSPLYVGFRRFDGVWKIDHLLPTSALNPRTSQAAPAY
jgi:hypothetical protein